MTLNLLNKLISLLKKKIFKQMYLLNILNVVLIQKNNQLLINKLLNKDKPFYIKRLQSLEDDFIIYC